MVPPKLNISSGTVSFDISARSSSVLDWSTDKSSLRMTPYLLAPSAETSFLSTSEATMAGSLCSGSPQPPPPHVLKYRRSPLWTLTPSHLAGTCSSVPSALTSNLVDLLIYLFSDPK